LSALGRSQTGISAVFPFKAFGIGVTSAPSSSLFVNSNYTQSSVSVHGFVGSGDPLDTSVAETASLAVLVAGGVGGIVSAGSSDFWSVPVAEVTDPADFLYTQVDSNLDSLLSTFTYSAEAPAEEVVMQTLWTTAEEVGVDLAEDLLFALFL
jgi:hypothetical protein